MLTAFWAFFAFNVQFFLHINSIAVPSGYIEKEAAKRQLRSEATRHQARAVREERCDDRKAPAERSGAAMPPRGLSAKLTGGKEDRVLKRKKLGGR